MLLLICHRSQGLLNSLWRTLTFQIFTREMHLSFRASLVIKHNLYTRYASLILLPLKAERIKKDKRRTEKADQEEEQRKKIDREEAAIAAEKRRMAIERANKMLYDDSDKVKSFHSNLMLSDVLKEREAQIEITRQKKKNERRREKYWAEMQTEACEEYDIKEKEKREEERRRKYEVE